MRQISKSPCPSCVCAPDQSFLSLFVTDEEVRLLQSEQLDVLVLSVLQARQQVGTHLWRAEPGATSGGGVKQTSQHAPNELQV